MRDTKPSPEEFHMKKVFAACLLVALFAAMVPAQAPQQDQNPQQNQKPPGVEAPEDVVRITTSLVQTDVVVMDKNDHIIPDLTLADFKVLDNGKRQDLKFMEFVSANAGPRMEGQIKIEGQPVEPDVARNLSTRDLHSVFAFVVDDLTIPYADVISVRKLLTDFVNNQMREGDLVGIVRVVGGRGILQQFTSDKQLLRRAIAEIRPTFNSYSAFNNPTQKEGNNPQPMQAAVGDGGIAMPEIAGLPDIDTTDEGITRAFRALITLELTGDVINGMKTLPGRKTLVLISGGLPLYETSQNQITVNGIPTPIVEVNNYIANVSYLLRQLTDRASRAGVVVNTMDIRGLKSSRGVSLFTDPGNEGRSALFGGGGSDPNFGRAPNMGQFDNKALDTLSGHLGLQALANATGGVSVINTSDFDEGLARIINRSNYYLLAFTPSEPFDGKFHKLEIKVDRPGATVYTRAGYIAKSDEPSTEPKTAEQAILKAVMSPLAKRDLDVNGRLQYRFLPDNRADVDINMLIDANNLNLKQETDGKYHATFDVVGFVANSQGKSLGGFSQTVSVSLLPQDYQRALTYGISYTGHAQLPPGMYQLRAAVRETATGRLGSMSQFVEVPDLTRKRLTASSLFLYAVDPALGNKAKPDPLTGLRQLSRKDDLRYAAIIYNPKMKDGKTQLQAHIIISRSNKVLFQEAEQPVTGAVENGQVAKIGQFGLGKVLPGRLMLTLVITDPLADKPQRTVVRTIDFTLVD
jgi:VWFA-related protein